MPIEGYTVYPEAPKEHWDVPTVQPGQLKEVAIDYSDGEVRSIRAGCLPNNKGGIVFFVDQQRLWDAEDPTEAYKRGERELIRPGPPYKREIITGSGRAATLVLKLTAISKPKPETEPTTPVQPTPPPL